MAMKRQSFLSTTKNSSNGRNGIVVNGNNDLLSDYHQVIQQHQHQQQQPYSNHHHTFTYGSSYARARDAALLATSLHWNRDIKSTTTLNQRSPPSANGHQLQPYQQQQQQLSSHHGQHPLQHQQQHQYQQHQSNHQQTLNHSHYHHQSHLPPPPPPLPPSSSHHHHQHHPNHHPQHHLHPYQQNHELVPGINKPFSLDNPMIRTIGQHYYPEGGWGWIISVCSSLCYFITAALFPAHSFLILDIMRTFKPDEGILAAVLIGAFSTMVTLIFSPVIIALCRRKSIRLTAVVGGLVTALGCLFTSFATQFHQLLISYGIFIGIGVSMLRDTSVIMIGQYFKKRREFVEIFVLTGNGLGIALMPIFLSFCIRSQSWRTGFQSLALVAFINFFIGVLYRPASLYHPQRRAILHLKSLQKKSRHREAAQGLYTANLAALNANNNNNANNNGKNSQSNNINNINNNNNTVNNNNSSNHNLTTNNNQNNNNQQHSNGHPPQITAGPNAGPGQSGSNNTNNSIAGGQHNAGGGSGGGPHKPPYFDFSILKSKTIRILLSGTCISSFGLWAPIFLLVSSSSVQSSSSLLNHFN